VVLRVVLRLFTGVALVDVRQRDVPPRRLCTAFAVRRTCERSCLSAGVTCSASRWPSVSTTMWTFEPFLRFAPSYAPRWPLSGVLYSVRLIGVEEGGRGAGAGNHAAPLTFGTPGVLHGSMSYVLQDAYGQTADVHSCSAGLDYPGVGPEHSWWRDTGRVEYVAASDAEALEAFQLFARLEGIIPALETSHAIHGAVVAARAMRAEQNLVINVSGRGDKDVTEVMRLLG
jgi:tryptophan synthase beta subunit